MPDFWTTVCVALIGLAVVGAGLIVWVAVLQTRLSRLNRQYTQLMAGYEGGNLEQALNGYLEQTRQAVKAVSSLEVRTHRIEQTLEHSLQWLGVVRFSPFRETGGAQSFSLAVADGQGDGVVLSSLHSRENTRVYAKPLVRWDSPHTLTEEEKEAIARARHTQT